MITEDYVSFEVAKLLKEKGFDEPIQCFYKFDSKELYRGTIFTNTQIGDKFYNAPTHQMAMKWLREVHNIVCNIDIESRNFYYYSIFIIRSSIEAQYQLTSQKPYFETYEEACEAAIKYCLDNLI